jgi:hypothetical protein
MYLEVSNVSMCNMLNQIDHVPKHKMITRF